jgi:signal transduction histidine kinase
VRISNGRASGIGVAVRYLAPVSSIWTGACTFCNHRFVQVRPATLAPPLGGNAPDTAAVRDALHARLTASTAQKVVAAAIVPMVAVSLALGLTNEHLTKPVVSALYYGGYLVAAPFGVGLYWWVRRPASRFGPLLVAFGVAAWLEGLAFTDSPIVSALATPWLPVNIVLTFFLFLAFPMGRLEPRGARWVLGALVLSFSVSWPLVVLFSPMIVSNAPMSECTRCPENVLNLGSNPGLVHFAAREATFAGPVCAAALLVVYAVRLKRATPPQRRALVVVAVNALLFMTAFVVWQGSRVFNVDPATAYELAWGVVATTVLLPLVFLIALVQAELFAARALRTLLERLTTRPTPEQWRESVASALGDDALRLAFYDPETRRFLQSDGEELGIPAEGSGHVWVPVDRGAGPVAAMVIDETLVEDPELVRAASAATLLAVEAGALEGELRTSRTRILEAGYAERRRIERDLHDSAQQRLLALRIHLTLAAEGADPDQRETLDQLGLELDEAVEELREVAHGLYPPILARAGVGPALKAIAGRSGMKVTVSDDLGRQSEAVETAIYFCCLECLQNAAKHAGPGAHVEVRLRRVEDRAQFSVEDDGLGFEPAGTARGAGLTNLSNRVAAVGGTLRIDSSPGHGTRITGDLPEDPALPRIG